MIIANPNPYHDRDNEAPQTLPPETILLAEHAFSDSPLAPVRALACRAEERRDDDAAAVVLFRRLLPGLLAGTMP